MDHWGEKSRWPVSCARWTRTDDLSTVHSLHANHQTTRTPTTHHECSLAVGNILTNEGIDINISTVGLPSEQSIWLKTSPSNVTQWSSTNSNLIELSHISSRYYMQTLWHLQTQREFISLQKPWWGTSLVWPSNPPNFKGLLRVPEIWLVLHSWEAYRASSQQEQ